MRPPLCVLAALCALAATGCGDVDTGKAEDAIEKGIREQTGAKEVRVDCPSDVEAKKGDTFECRATVAGETAPVSVTQQDDDGNIRWRFRRP